jgi:hypothetical protein
VRRDLSGGQPVGIEREDDLIDPVEPALSLLHDHRLKGALPVARDVDLHMPGGLGQHRLGTGPVADVGRVPVLGGTVLLMPQVLGHLLVERGLQHALGELLGSPSGPVRDRPCSLASRTSSSAASSSAEGSGFFIGLTTSSVVITAPLR